MTTEEFIRQHKHTNYCEVVISPNGDIEYAIPSHTNKLIEISGKSKSELESLMPWRAAPLDWLVGYTGFASVWFNTFILPEQHTDIQLQALQKLCNAGIIQNKINGKVTTELSHCAILEILDVTGDEALLKQIKPVSYMTLRKESDENGKESNGTGGTKACNTAENRERQSP